MGSSLKGLPIFRVDIHLNLLTDLGRRYMNVLEEIKNFFIDFLYHTPKENLNTEEIELVKSKGLIHFCEEEKAERIIKEGVKGNLQKPMRKAEKGFTWFYINDEKNFSKNMNIIHKKGYREKYDSYVVIKELDDRQINKLRIRRNLDYAVIYPGNLLTKNMKSYKIRDFFHIK